MPPSSETSPIRNVAIIAHVDHGKTTLVDQLLKQSGNFRAGELEKLEGGQHGLIMDSNPLERERGITILSKNCAINYADEAGKHYRINVIDTPGHADFGGEVERVLRMADGCLLIVDAFEGPMPQTRFVLGKALEAGLLPVVVLNKCDRPDAEPKRVINQVFDLLVDLGAEDHALEFPVVYASAKAGWSSRDTADTSTPGTLRPVFEAIIEHVPEPKDDDQKPLQMLVTTLDYSDYTGRIGIGRVYAGVLRSGQTVVLMKRDGSRKTSRVTKLQRFEGLGRVDTPEVRAGDLCAVPGLEGVDIGDTIADPDSPVALPSVTIDEPTISMTFRVNDSPFAGQEGKFVTSRQIKDRLTKELERNVALRVAPGGSTDESIVSGRGILHLGILLETMRREGYELAVGRPIVILKDIDGVVHEPIEELVVEAPESAVGPVMEMVGARKGELVNMEPRGTETSHMVFRIASRALIGLRSRLMTATQGQAILHHSFDKYVPVSGERLARNNGVLIAIESGQVTGHAVEGLADRGILYVKPGDKVYAGQVVGENSRDNDLVVNITREKQLNNIRSANKESFVTLKAPRQIGLEAALEYIEDDEAVEITPKSIRIRKRVLDHGARRRDERQSKDKAPAGV